MSQLWHQGATWWSVCAVLFPPSICSVCVCVRERDRDTDRQRHRQTDDKGRVVRSSSGRGSLY